MQSGDEVLLHHGGEDEESCCLLHSLHEWTTQQKKSKRMEFKLGEQKKTAANENKEVIHICEFCNIE